MKLICRFLVPFLVLLAPAKLLPQGTLADYQRANQMRTRFQGLALNLTGPVQWVDGTPRFYYRKSVTGGNEFVVMDADTLAKRPAFDHQRLAASLSEAAGETYTGLTLPFSEFRFVEKESAIEFAAASFRWRCGLDDYACRKTGPASPTGPGGRRRPPEEEWDSPSEF